MVFQMGQILFSRIFNPDFLSHTAIRAEAMAKQHRDEICSIEKSCLYFISNMKSVNYGLLSEQSPLAQTAKSTILRECYSNARDSVISSSNSYFNKIL
mmetsp:Transcript_965/g.1801  ORF Transcript_965/g.1801 Transcript_965/m.1801 type:complete len:98 (+) Transcript_965:324-617(+)